MRNATAFVAQPWQVVRLSRETMQDQIWRVKVAQVWLSSVAGWSPGTYQLMWASNDETGEEKYFVCDAAPGTEVEVMVRVGFRRWSVEHLFRICKSEIGFTNFEGRNYRALMRHMTVCLVCLAFASEQTEQLRGEKSGDHVGAGVPGCEIWDPEVVGATPPTQRLGESAKRVGVSPKTKPGSPRVQEKAGRESARSQKAKPSKEASQSANANGSIQVAL